MYILKVYSILYTLRQNTNDKKFTSDKISNTKNALFFYCEFQLITVLLLISYSYLMT